MAYKWGLEDLKRDCLQLSKMIQEETDIAKKFKLQECLDYLNHYIFISQISVNEKQSSTKDDFLETMNCCVHSKRYYNLVADFYFDVNEYRDDMLALSDQITELLGKHEDFTFLTKAKVSTKKVLFLTDIFYKKFDTELYIIYQEAIKNRKENLKFVKHHSQKYYATEKDAYTLFIEALRKAYISVDKSTSYKKYIDLIHEYGHVIAFFVNPTYQCSSEIYFNELPSLFPELVALFDEDSNIDEVQKNHWLFSNLITYFEYSNYLVLQKMLYDAFEKNNSKYNLKLLLKLYKDYKIDNKKLKEILSFSIYENGNYVVSFEAALELVYIYYYEQNKEKALQIFKNILRQTDISSEFGNIYNELDLGKHTNFMVNEIISKMRKSLDMVKNNEKLGHSIHKTFKGQM